MSFLNELKKTQNYTETENGAVALHSTMNACLDAFGSLGAMRFSDESDIIEKFSHAFYEDRALAMRMLFYMRDIRGGQGARKVFRVIAKWLADYQPVYIINNLDNFLAYGRGDDVICLLDTSVKDEVIHWAYQHLKTDWIAYKAGAPCSLLAKWMPSENASSKETREAARAFIEGFKCTPRTYRKMLTALRSHLKVVEQKMSAREWKAINYEAVPAKAAINYANAFINHDQDGYIKYLTNVANGEAKVNAASLFPVDIVHKALNNRSPQLKDRILLDAMWKALPDYCADHEETGICVVDVSGSMSGLPMEVALSLGMYCADKCRGPFAGHFITFSANPQLVEIVGKDVFDKVHGMESADWSMNTNLEAVFDLLLNTAQRARTPAEDMPKKLYIISDMQFDAARDTTYDGWYGRRAPRRPFMQEMRRKYEAAGYEMPIIVYWNVRQSNCGMFQDTFEGEQCCMVSGYSASLFKSIIEGTTYEEVITIKADGTRETTLKETVDPMTVMLTTLSNERYNAVWVG